MKSPHDRLIVALDVDSLEKAVPLVEELAPYVGCFKVGLELLTAEGAPKVVHQIHKLGGKVFFDGKFSDIPNTVASASKALAGLKVRMFDVHASCGLDSIRAAAEHKGDSLLLVVTVLTSFDEASAQHVFGDQPTAKVKLFALDAALAGADGVVCSPKELEILQNTVGTKHLLKVTPGIRPAWAESNDQKRVLTPKEAIQAGATHLVIGRPLLRPPREIGSPKAAAQRILDEIASAL